MRDEHINVILRGRKFKRMIDDVFESMRNKYGFKQIELEMMLYLNEKPLSSASDIHRALELNKGQVSQALESLCQKKFLEAIPDTNDRRYIYYELTKNSNPIINDCKCVSDSMTKMLFDGFDEDEIESMKRITQKICHNIDVIISNTYAEAK